MTTSSQAHREGNAVVHLYTYASGRPAAAAFIHPHRSLGPSFSAPPHDSGTQIQNTDPARKHSEIPFLGVADDPIQFGLPLGANANLAARVQA